MNLHRHIWAAPKARAAVLLIHGVGEHGGRYDKLVAPLNSAGYSVYGVDLRGHGRSPGRRGHISVWSDYLDDLSAARDWCTGEAAGLPLFVFGHSMGSLLALDHLLIRPEGVQAAAVTGVPFAPVGVARPAKVAAVRLLARCWPTFTIPLGIDPRLLTSQFEPVAHALKDPLTHGRVTVRWGVEILGAIERVRRSVSALSTPLLIGHGGADRINDPSGARELDRQIACAHRLVIYEGNRHEVHNDAGHRQLAADVIDWFDRHRAVR
jgi:alpha-beta hydrolase superfamily lysophospholipase